MVLFALFIGAILIVAAIRNSQGALFAALYQDVPAFVVWAAAIFAVGAVGFIPGLKPVSRGLLALVIVVIVMNNYEKILAGFANAWQHPPAAAPDAKTSDAGSAASGAPSSLDLNSLLSSGVNAFGASSLDLSALAGSGGL